MGFCRRKLTRVSGRSSTFCPLVMVFAPAPAPAPAVAPMAAPLPPPKIPPRIAPTAAPPPTFSGVLATRVTFALPYVGCDLVGLAVKANALKTEHQGGSAAVVSGGMRFHDSSLNLGARRDHGLIVDHNVVIECSVPRIGFVIGLGAQPFHSPHLQNCSRWNCNFLRRRRR